MKTSGWLLCLACAPFMVNAVSVPLATQLHLLNTQTMQSNRSGLTDNAPSGGGGIPVIDVAAIKVQAWESYRTQPGSDLSYEQWNNQVWKKIYENQ
ncbi:hypothetical protein H3J60_004572 [Salmonella enterica]|nr:hypothetical protein [Salmonella enterica]